MKLSDFLRQPSTLRGMILLAAFFSYKVNPDNLQDILIFSGNLIALIEVFRNENKGAS